MKKWAPFFAEFDWMIALLLVNQIQIRYSKEESIHFLKITFIIDGTLIQNIYNACLQEPTNDQTMKKQYKCAIETFAENVICSLDSFSRVQFLVQFLVHNSDMLTILDEIRCSDNRLASVDSCDADSKRCAQPENIPN